MTELRLRKGLPYQEVADKVGCTDRYMHDIETGKANPTIGILQAVADFHHVKLSRLISLAEDKYARCKRPTKKPAP